MAVIVFITAQHAKSKKPHAYVFDELRVGRDYAAVLPEPASAALVFTGVMTCCLARRR